MPVLVNKVVSIKNHPLRPKNQPLGVQSLTLNKKIVEPNSIDVLSGRGKHNYRHHGNKYFLSVLKQHQSKHAVRPKSSRLELAKMIYSDLRKHDPPVRFLKRGCAETENDAWYEMSHKEAVAKIRHAMRDLEARLKKKSKNATNLNQGRNICSHSFSISKIEDTKARGLFQSGDHEDLPQLPASPLSNAAQMNHSYLAKKDIYKHLYLAHQPQHGPALGIPINGGFPVATYITLSRDLRINPRMLYNPYNLQLAKKSLPPRFVA